MTTASSTRTLYLEYDAPFAAFRWLQAGVFRGTYPVIPPSAAWGLALNLAGIDTRGSVDEVVTPIRPDAPRLEVAVGVVRAGERSTLYQQLHGYPVGSSGKELQAKAHGQKYWIAPAKRELLAGLVGVIGIRGDPAIVERIPRGLAGTLDVDRYGLPFAGDNQFLFSRIDVIEADDRARWFVPLSPGEAPAESTRLTCVIDRGDASRTHAPLFAPTPSRCPCPDAAWVTIGGASVSLGPTPSLPTRLRAARWIPIFFPSLHCTLSPTASACSTWRRSNESASPTRRCSRAVAFTSSWPRRATSSGTASRARRSGSSAP